MRRQYELTALHDLIPERSQRLSEPVAERVAECPSWPVLSVAAKTSGTSCTCFHDVMVTMKSLPGTVASMKRCGADLPSCQEP